jgi:hypothetical protein
VIPRGLERTAPLPPSTRTIWKLLRQQGRLAPTLRRRYQPLERPAPMTAWQIDFKDASTVPADPESKQQHVVEILNVVDMGTSIVIAAHADADFHAQTAGRLPCASTRSQCVCRTLPS